MYKALFYKEWIKLKAALFLLIIITLITYLVFYINLKTLIKVQDAYTIWYFASVKGAIFYDIVKYLIPFSGFIIGIAQFFPETMQRKLRLLFHLPIDHNKSLGFMALIGCFFLFFLILINYFLLIFILKIYFPFVILQSAFITSLPWFISGFAAYFGIILVSIEPSIKGRLIYGFHCFFLVLIFFKGTFPNMYEKSIGYYWLLIFIYIFTIFYPAFRFKRGLD
ncbi:MAG: hypothetical protein RBR08_14080 [Desulforegulaceae bacterium]|nr:hypothetical protein [Desulforegulaceae bacterium]